MSISTPDKQKNTKFWGLKRTKWALILQRAKIAAPAHAAVLILTILVLIEPVALAIGKNAFLVITYLILFFYPQGTTGEHIENVVVNIGVCAVGQAIDFLVVCCAIWIDGGNKGEYSTDGSKALGACILVLLCFMGGLCQSLYPRMKMAIRILLFSSTWTITSGASTIQSTIFTDQFYPAALAAGASLFARLVLYPRNANDNYATLLVKVFALNHAVLDQAVTDFFGNEEANCSKRQPSLQFNSLRKSLLNESVILKKNYQDARLELTYGRISLAATKPLLSVIHRANEWISCGMGLGTREALEMPSDYEADASILTEEAKMPHDYLDSRAFHSGVTALLAETASAIDIVRACIELTTGGDSSKKVKSGAKWNILYEGVCHDPTALPGLCVTRQNHELSAAIENFKAGLLVILKQRPGATEPDYEADLPSRRGEFPGKKQIMRLNLLQSDTYDAAFLMVSLLEIAKEISTALTVCQTMITVWQLNERKRIWWPSLTVGTWLRKKHSPELLTEAIYDHDILEQERHDLELLTREESRVVRPNSTTLARSMLAWLREPKAVQSRVKLSRLIASLKRNIHLRFALKLAGGVALLSIAAWLTNGRPWFEADRGLWAVVTYIYVLETSTGATIRISLYRAIATIAGALWAIIAWYISGQGNRYAVAFFIVLAQVPASYFILFSKKAQSMGLVFGYTQSIIILVPLMPASGSQQSVSVVHLGLLRAYQILIGIAAAFLVNTMVWPLHARVHLIRTISYITTQCSAMYLILARQMLSHDARSYPEDAKQSIKLRNNIEGALSASREYLDMMQSEWSLVPKPTQTLSLIVKTLQKTIDLLVLLQKCREVTRPIIQQNAGIDVLNFRKELISNVLLNLWITGQSLRTREKLPQFIPSCRLALNELTEAMSEEIDQYLPKLQLSDYDTGQEGGDRIRNSQEIIDRAMLTITPPSIFFTPRKRSPIHSGQTTPRTDHARRNKMLDHTYFYLLAEHTILSELIFQIEKLQLQAKLLVGESSFVDGTYGSNNVSHGYDVEAAMADM